MWPRRSSFYSSDVYSDGAFAGADMSAKRNSPDVDDEADSRVPSAKRLHRVVFEAVKIPAVSTVSDLDHHTLAFQHRKLVEQMNRKGRLEFDLRKRIEQLEKRQTQDDAMLCIINRHWNRLDEDLRILLQRFDAETSIECELENESETTTSFLNQLSHWDKDEVDKRLSQRVEFSRRATAKLVQVFDRLNQRNEKISDLLKQALDADADDSLVSTAKTSINEHLVKMNAELQEETKRLQAVSGKLERQNHSLFMQHSKLNESLAESETKVEEMRNKLDDTQYELDKSKNLVDKLEFRLAEMGKQVQSLELRIATAPPTVAAPNVVVNSVVNRSTLDDIQQQLEESRELASSRLTEMRDLTDRHKEALQTVENLKNSMRQIPEEVIIGSAEYKSLQSQFSVLYNESVQIRQQLEECRNQLATAKTAHLKQIEQMESEELLAQKQLRATMIQLEDQTSQVRREYEMLRVEFEQNLAANEQSGPVNKEMRHLLNSYKTQNHQLKAEIGRFKKKWRDACSAALKIQKELDEEKKLRLNSITFPSIEAVSAADTPLSPMAVKEETSVGADKVVKTESHTVESLSSTEDPIKQEKCPTGVQSEVDELRNQIAQLTAECSRLKSEVRRLVEVEKKERKKLVAEESQKRVKQLEEQVEQLKKDVANSKQEEDALLNEMEVTGQAFEDMQEQNLRLLQQLREKDDANFKLMSERIRSNQQQKLLKEEKDLIDDQVVALQNQVGAQILVVRKLEEKERLLQGLLSTVEKELSLRQQGLELNKRKAIEAAQSAADLKLQVGKLQEQLNEVQAGIAEKTATLEEENFKTNRLQEEISMLKKKVERAKKIEMADTADEVLLEEIRELKEQLTCPSCKVQRKDAILTKCFHVFCMDCLKTRYETRQRKCPKCNGGFGANDFRRIYIS